MRGELPADVSREREKQREKERQEETARMK